MRLRASYGEIELIFISDKKPVALVCAKGKFEIKECLNETT